jgi:hypothetical protein
LKIGTAEEIFGTAEEIFGTAEKIFRIASVKICAASVKIGIAAVKIGIASVKIGTASVKIGTASVKIGTAAVKIGTASVKIGTAEGSGDGRLFEENRQPEDKHDETESWRWPFLVSTVKFIAVTIAFPRTLPRFFLGGGAHDDQVREMLKGRKISPPGEPASVFDRISGFQDLGARKFLPGERLRPAGCVRHPAGRGFSRMNMP